MTLSDAAKLKYEMLNVSKNSKVDDSNKQIFGNAGMFQIFVKVGLFQKGCFNTGVKSISRCSFTS